MHSPRLTALLGSSLQEIRESSLRTLVEGAVCEDQDLDFKQKSYDHGPKGTFEIAKDTAAMANQVGGLVIIGIAEDELGHAAELTPVPISDAEKGKILQAVADRIHPMVRGFEIRMVPTEADPTLGYLILDVPHSVTAPHAVRRDDRPGVYCYPQRHGTTTIYLTEPQIAARYRSRFELARSQVDRLEQLHRNAYALTYTGAALLAIGAVPALAGFRPLTGDGKKIQTYIEEVWNPAGTTVDPTQGEYRTARRRLRSTTPTLAVELHEDGSAWAQTAVGHARGDGVCVINPAELEKTAVVLTAFVGGYVAWAGAAGDCAVGAWLTYSPGKGPVQLGSWEPVNLPAQGACAETTAPVEELGSDPVRVGQIVYPLVRDIEQDLGLPQPEALRPDGSTLVG